MSKEKQLSRAAGVPRRPLAIWKAAAKALLVGPEVTRKQQQGGKWPPHKILRELVRTDSAWRSKFLEFDKTEGLKTVKKQMAAQGVVAAEGTDVTGADEFTYPGPSCGRSLSDWIDDTIIEALDTAEEGEQVVKALKARYPEEFKNSDEPEPETAQMGCCMCAAKPPAYRKLSEPPYIPIYVWYCEKCKGAAGPNAKLEPHDGVVPWAERFYSPANRQELRA